jgi:plasmid stabilization system protein ParE
VSYNVELTAQAQLDLLQIIEYCASKVDSAFAEKKLVEIEQAVNSLSHQPTRGHKPHELHNISTSKQLEIIINRIRIIYQIRNNNVFVTAIFDGRQNVQAHLLKRIQKSH